MKHLAKIVRRSCHAIRGNLQSALFAIGTDIESEEREEEKRRGRLAINDITEGLKEIEGIIKDLEGGKKDA